MTTVSVLLGGISAEREVSIQSGQRCSRALLKEGFSVREIDITTTDLATIGDQLTPRPDVVFNALHGTFGEDGGIQKILNTLRIAYTHSGVASSSLCMDKSATIATYKKHSIPSLQNICIKATDLCEDAIPFKRPFVIKPSNNGSSIGLHIVLEGMPLPPMEDWKWGDILVEPYVAGLEFTVAVLQGKALCVTEIVPKTGTYTYAAKYQKGITKHICPANIDKTLSNKLMEYAQIAHTVLGCNGISRTDFRYDPRTQTIATLETNTQPGMTETSIVPEQATHMGIGFGQLLHTLITTARTDNA